MTRDFDYSIRPAQNCDMLDLRRAAVELQDFEHALHDTRLPGEQVAVACLEQEIATVRRAGGQTLVAEVDGVFAGCVSFWIRQDDVAGETADSNRDGYVGNICVLAAFRGRNVAGALLAAAEESLSVQGITRLRINVLANNASARRAYEKAGFAPYEVMYEKKI